ncbi:hypothetical protein CEP52_012623 [Fusarium oligoseptatum]|uniref:Uncharacterized protein n=1 Tax=Fusarium oligoseptatum TaxID=2604345 RepID=A0A428SXI1_9HYPO|nr:hypothetical protein CEP52_012623 [Fusarium oligoseptatum]
MMECFCHKLQTQRYHEVTETEPRKLPDSSSTSAISLRTRDQSLQVTTTLSSSASDLVKTYSYQNAVKTFKGGKLDVQPEGSDRGLFVEDLSTAEELLEQWTPLDQDPSLIEQVTDFRKHLLLGRILRFLGAFKESLVHLERARETAEHCKDLLFDEDLCDLTCEHADTLRELDDSGAAEHHLRAEIARRDQNGLSSGKSRLEISLAEALFAQGHFQEAEKLCLDIQSRPSLLKFDKLRLHITLAKIRHVQSDNEGALSYWSGAMKEIGKFKLTNGRATRIIVISICDTLSGLGQTWLVDESLKQVESLDEMAKPGGTQHWIAGLRHWLEYLESRSLRSHI